MCMQAKDTRRQRFRTPLLRCRAWPLPRRRSPLSRHMSLSGSPAAARKDETERHARRAVGRRTVRAQPGGRGLLRPQRAAWRPVAAGVMTTREEVRQRRIELLLDQLELAASNWV